LRLDVWEVWSQATSHKKPSGSAKCPEYRLRSARWSVHDAST